MIFSLFLLSSCVSNPYQAAAFCVYGYSVQNINKENWLVSYSYGGYISFESARDYALLRACQAAIENGYSHFKVISTAKEENKGRDYKKFVLDIILEQSDTGADSFPAQETEWNKKKRYFWLFPEVK